MTHFNLHLSLAGCEKKIEPLTCQLTANCDTVNRPSANQKVKLIKAIYISKMSKYLLCNHSKSHKMMLEYSN